MLLSIKKDTLYIAGKELTFENTIGSIIILDDLIIVHLFKEEKNRTNMKEQTMNNVYALNSEGEIIWNIRDILDKDHCIVDVRMDEGPILVAFSYFSIRFLIDPYKRTVIDQVFTK